MSVLAAADDARVGRRDHVWDGRYALARTLGEGGMGRVVLAHDLAQGGRAVALKTLLPAFLDATPELLREYAIQRRLDHPCLPRAFDFGFANQPHATIPYFAMEHLEGYPLLTAMDEGLSAREVFDVVAATLSGLDCMHRRGLLHCDVKPGNVLVARPSRRRARTRAWLIDFGVASRLGGYTDEDAFVGTPEYASPEFMTGRGVDERADLYSAGLLLYELIEGRRPWDDTDPAALLVARQSPPPPPTAPGCSDAMAALLRDLLEPDPSRRPPSAAAVHARLCAAMGFDAPLESPEAFARRLRAVPLPEAERVAADGEALVDGLRAATQVEVGEDEASASRPARPRAIVVEAPPGFAARQLIAPIADRAAMLGARVLRVWLRHPCDAPLGALSSPLATLTRLHPGADVGPPDAMTRAAATRLIAGSGRPVVLVIEDLDRADASSLETVEDALASVAGHVRLLATTRRDEAPRGPGAFARLLSRADVVRRRLETLTPHQIDVWLDRALGPDGVGEADRDHLRAAAGGTPAGLIVAASELYVRGRIVRRGRGYAPGDAPEAPTPGPRPRAPPGDVSELDALVACVHAPVPEVAMRRYLGDHAVHLPHLLASGALVPSDDERLMSGDDARRDAVYARLEEPQRQRLHRRLALALEAVQDDDTVDARIAVEYLRSDTPLAAVNHLLRAAQRSAQRGAFEAARRWLDRTESLLRSRHEGRTELDLWRFWALLWRADARVSADAGDLDRYEGVVDKLFAMGTEMGHRQTLRDALTFRLDVDQRRGYWDRLVDDAGALLSLDADGPSPDAIARLRWAKALHARASGRVGDAVALISQGLDEGAGALGFEVRLALARARAELLVDLQWNEDARGAVDAYRHLAVRAGHAVHRFRARILEATLTRLRSLPGEALAAARRIVADIAGVRLPGVDGLLEWELGACHLAFGWFESAAEHARQACVLADRDGDPSLLVRALLLAAEALHAGGEVDRAWRAITEARRLSNVVDRSVEINARLAELELIVSTTPPRDLDAAIKEAIAIGWRARRHREGARAARAFGLAARGSVARRDPALATQLATLALSALDGCVGAHLHRPRHLWTAALAADLAGDVDAAHAHRALARHTLRAVADGFDDPRLEAAWLAHPDHARLFAG